MDPAQRENSPFLTEGRTYYDPEKKMSFPDKRYLPRWEVANRISYHLSQEPLDQECQSRDLSSAGICLETKEALPLHSKVNLVIHLSETSSFPVEGRVMWCRPLQERYLSGVHFEKISPQDQDLILQFAFEVRRLDVVNHWFEGWKS